MWLENIKKQDFWLLLEIEKVSIYNPIEQIEHNLEDLKTGFALSSFLASRYISEGFLEG